MVKFSVSLLNLRHYQLECIDKSIEAFNAGLKRICVSLPVGSGIRKTVTFANLIPRIPGSNTRYKVLILAHRKELLKQAHDVIKRYCPDLKIGVDIGRKSPDPDAQVIIASVNSLGRKGSLRIQNYKSNQFKGIIIDEAHHATAETYQRVLHHLGAYNENSSIKVWGCSATLRRHDGISLQPTFEKIVFHRKIADMIDDEWLCPVKLQTVKTTSSLKDVVNTSGDYNTASLAVAVDNDTRNLLILQSYFEGVEKYNRKSALIFAVNVQHVERLKALFRMNGIQACGIHSSTSSAEREDILHHFSNREIPVLINCGIMTEGVDIPSIDFLLLARPTRSSVLLQQMLGRGMRLYQDKDFCLVMDFVDVFSENMMSATVPTLLGLIEIDKKGYRKSEKENPSRNRVDCKETIIIQDKLDVELSPFINPFDFKSIEKDVNHIKAYSQLPWLRVGQKKWILNMLGSKNFIKLEYCNKKNLYIGKNVFRNENYITRDKVILSSDQFDFAIKGLDTFAKNNSTFVKLLQTYSEWRKLPITDRQRQLLMKWRIKYDQGISKGEASDLITRRLHGALSASLKKTREAKSEK